VSRNDDLAFAAAAGGQAVGAKEDVVLSSMGLYRESRLKPR